MLWFMADMLWFMEDMFGAWRTCLGHGGHVWVMADMVG